MSTPARHMPPHPPVTAGRATAAASASHNVRTVCIACVILVYMGALFLLFVQLKQAVRLCATFKSSVFDQCNSPFNSPNHRTPLPQPQAHATHRIAEEADCEDSENIQPDERHSGISNTSSGSRESEGTQFTSLTQV